MAENFFKQTPIAPSNLKPILPEGTDLNLLSDQINRETAKLAAENKKNMDERIANEYRIACDVARAETADLIEKRKKQEWHDDVARRNREAEEARQKGIADKAKRQLDARQKEIKAKLTALVTTCAEVETELDELTDKTCIQAKLAHTAISQLLHRLKWDAANE